MSVENTGIGRIRSLCLLKQYLQYGENLAKLGFLNAKYIFLFF